MAAKQGVVDHPIPIKLRTIYTMIAGSVTTIVLSVIGSLFWAQGTFTAQTDFLVHEKTAELRLNALAETVNDRFAGVTLWQMETRLEDITDTRRTLKIEGITTANRDYDHDLEKRQTKLTKQITCMQSGGKFCLNRAESN